MNQPTPDPRTVIRQGLAEYQLVRYGQHPRQWDKTSTVAPPILVVVQRIRKEAPTPKP